MKVNLNSPPKCRIVDYRFAGLSVSEEHVPSKKDGEVLDVELEDFFVNKKDANKYRVGMRVVYVLGDVEVRFTIKGIFHFDGLGDKVLGPAWLNALTILYGIARGYIACVTATNLCGQILLPTVMMKDLLDEKIKKDIDELKSRQLENSPGKKDGPEKEIKAVTEEKTGAK